MLCSLCCTLQYENHLKEIRVLKWLKEADLNHLDENANTCRAGRKAMRLRTSLKRWHEDQPYVGEDDRVQIAEVVPIRIQLWQLIASGVQEFVGGESGVLRYGCEAKRSHDNDETSWDKANRLSEKVNQLSKSIKEKQKQIKRTNKILEDGIDTGPKEVIEEKLKQLKAELVLKQTKLHRKQPKLDAAQNEVRKKHLFSFLPEKGLKSFPPKEGGNGEPYVSRKLRQVFASRTCT